MRTNRLLTLFLPLCLGFSFVMFIQKGRNSDVANRDEQAQSKPSAVEWPTRDPKSIPHYPDVYKELPKKINSFQERLMSPEDFTRYRLLGEVSKLLPEREAESLIRQMMKKDPSPNLRNQAVIALIGWGYPVAKEDFDYADFATIKNSWLEAVNPDIHTDFDCQLTKLRQSIELGCCGKGRWSNILDSQEPCENLKGLSIKCNPSQAAMILSVFGDKSDILRLGHLLECHNPYVVYTTANALINLGDTESGEAALIKISKRTPKAGIEYYVRQALFKLRMMHNVNNVEDPVKMWEEVKIQVEQLKKQPPKQELEEDDDDLKQPLGIR